MDEQMNTRLPRPPTQRSQSHQWELTTLHRANSQHIRRLAWCSARLDAVHLMGSTSQFSSDSYRARINSPAEHSGVTLRGRGRGCWVGGSQNQAVGCWHPETLGSEASSLRKGGLGVWSSQV